ncbi:LysM receptor kinase [Quillaja saponaria]|uniref:LysM receptor kinase n=1 Tax=Quillaja saponaria TaxID=32244 RepID=A0AAD7M0W5_QUISA|nr:LysM receptor kinase [Quillaja saponaria]
MIQIFLVLFILTSIALYANAQQNYSANSVLSCKNNDENGPSPAFLYTCNGMHHSCKSFLIFQSQPPYNSIPMISNLTSTNLEELARINNVMTSTFFPMSKEVIVPVNCSCLAKDYYQANTKYITSGYETYFVIANNTYQGLSTCDSLKRANPYGELEIRPGLQLNVPLRCACPTSNQTAKGIKYLLTYSVYWGDKVENISKRFNVSTESILDANGFSTRETILYPFTTILIPLPIEPSSSQTVIHNNQTVISPPPPSNPIKQRRKRKFHLLVAIAVSCFVLLLSLILFAIYLHKMRSGSSKRVIKGRTKWVSTEEIRVEIASIEHVSKLFSFEEINTATENFNSKNRLKGSVYRGVFDREILAVKKTSTDASKEVNMQKKINHFNLTKLEGYCENHGSFYLVFEYMNNGSLREWLSRNNSEEHHSWDKRLQIALDVANGLYYLHYFTEPCYVHKNINANNILLNIDLRAKIANFKLATETKKEITFGPPTTNVVGKGGYMAPECMKTGLVTPKIDVYAYGVLLLELITGRDSVLVQNGKRVMLSAAIVPLIESESAEAELSLFVDPRLKGNYEEGFALQLAKLSVACLIQEPTRRPDMGEVVSSLLKMHTVVHRIKPSETDDSRLER